MKNIIIFLLLVTSFNAGAQDIGKTEAKILLKKIAQNYGGENYILSFRKKIYETNNLQNIIEDVSGKFILGTNHKYRLEQSGTLVIQDKNFSFVIDSTENTMYIDRVNNDILPIEMGGFLNDSIYKNFAFLLKKDKEFSFLTVKSILGDESTVFMKFNNKTYEISNIEYHFPPANYFGEQMDDETVETPVMIIDYAPIVRKNIATETFSMNEWLVVKKDIVQLNSAVAGFEFFDLRPESHK